MFCSKCGNSLEDNAKFCDKCGNPTGSVTSGDYDIKKEKVIDNEVKLVVKPKFKAMYHMLGGIIASVITGMFVGFASMAGGEIGVGLIVMLIITLIGIGISRLSIIFKKMQIEKMEYSFYNTKVCYKDSFLNQVEKEVKYKHIK